MSSQSSVLAGEGECRGRRVEFHNEPRASSPRGSTDCVDAAGGRSMAQGANGAHHESPRGLKAHGSGKSSSWRLEGAGAKIGDCGMRSSKKLSVIGELRNSDCGLRNGSNEPRVTDHE